jgi:tol-pal system protein YbgF
MGEEPPLSPGAREMKRLLPLAAVCSLLAACVSPSDVQKLQSQISELQDQIAQVKKTASSKQEVENVNQKIVDQTNTLLKSNAQLVVKVQQIDEKMNGVSGQIETAGSRLDHIGQQVTQAQHDIEALKAAQAAAASVAVQQPIVTPQPMLGPGPAGPAGQMTVAATGGRDENPVEIYNAAYGDYQRGNYALAISGFHEFIQKNPSSDLADNAAYWIGDSLYSEKKYTESIEAFDVVVNKYAKSDKVPGALLKKAYAYLALGDKARAIVQLQYVVHEHPKAQEASLARQKLKQLGVDSK